jgi:histidyl-tRNA synthetase
MSKLNRPRGTQDIYPPRSLLCQKVRQIISKSLQQNNYQPVFFPTFESVELFTNSLGSTTDIVHKEMFIFFDRKGRSLALRPEGTASVVRLVCENKLIQEGYPLKFYYWANFFRYERPQKGRYREFWQLGVELINAKGIVADYQLLKLIDDIFSDLGIKDFVFSLNYLGNSETKENYKSKLKKFIEAKDIDLCENCQERYQNNPLRILDCSICKKKTSFPSYKEVWDEKDKKYVAELDLLLKKFKFPCNYDYSLVRGLDYYTGLVFEVSLGENKALLGGGRYDKLYQEIGGVDAPALGFAIGIDRLINYLETSGLSSKLLADFNKIDVFFFLSVPDFYPDVLDWKEKLKKCSLTVDYNLETRKLKNFSKIVSYYQPRLLIILGEKELKTEKIIIKDCFEKKDLLVEKKDLLVEKKELVKRIVKKLNS